jgi:hypothetical protein
MCKIGYIRQKSIEKVSLFRVPKDKVSEWQRLIPRKDKVLTSNHFTCEKHFSEEFIRREVNTELYSVSTIFDHQVFNLIKYCELCMYSRSKN